MALVVSEISPLPVTAKVKVLQNPDQVVIHIISVKEEVVATVAAVPVEGEVVPGAAGEPEVVKKGKKDEAAPPAAADKGKAPAAEKGKKK